ncbi:MAG: HAMP domain-containing sensor histidine kinase [Spirulinaceae cyanobacterium]
MTFFSSLRSIINQIKYQGDPRSLRLRLTVGMVAFSALGIGGVALWTSWKIQDILVTTHKKNLVYVAERFPEDVEAYSEMLTRKTALRKAIDNIDSKNVLIWVEQNGKIIARSQALQTTAKKDALVSRSPIAAIPKVYEVQGSYWVICSTPLQVKNAQVGEFYLAQDITEDQIMFWNMISSLCLASFLALTIITLAIAFYIQRSLQPLKRMSQLTETVSADHLGEVQLHLENAPSEVRELAQTFEQMLIRLDRAWEQQRQFVSNVSHELRTPLTIVSGYLQSTLRRGDNLRELQREALEIASSEADRTIQLLQDLLDLARADSGYLSFKLEPLTVNNLVAEIVAMAKQYSNREIEIKPPSENIEVKADRDRLKQVLLNLIDNAVKYSDNSQPVKVVLERLKDQATIQICDRGPGISLQHQVRIFERFYRIDEARCRSTGGTGLGLSIVKTLVEGMGGSVSVRSNPGQGSTFTVTLLLV